MRMIAQCTGLEPGELVHVIADAHIYDRHVDRIRELLDRKPQPQPVLWVNPKVHDFYAFTPEDVKLLDYEVAGPQITGIPVAV